MPNRALLTDRLQQAISLADRNHTQLALLFLDLDGFKLLPDIAAADGVSGLVKKILACIATPLDWHGPILVTTASVGIAIYPRDGGTAQKLIDQADAAMYRAKSPPRTLGTVTSRPGPKRQHEARGQLI